MTNDELKKYKEQIERLKKDFHKDSLGNIENIKNSSETKTESLFRKKNLDSTKQTNNLEKTNPTKLNKKIDSSEKNILSNSKPLENNIQKLENKIEKEIPLQEIKKEVLEIKAETPKPVSEIKKEEKKETPKQVKESRPEPKQISEAKEKNIIPPPEPPKNKATNEEEKNKSSILKFIIPIVLILIIGAGVYYFMNKDNSSKQELAYQKLEEKRIADSILEYDKIQQTEVDNVEIKEPLVAISDTIFNIISNQKEAYYAILGSYSELKNAKNLKRNHKTKFEAVVFEQNPIRVGLKLNENSVFEDLEQVREKFPNAWLLYNKN